MVVVLALLITVVSVGVVESAEDVIENPEMCRVARNFRNLFDRAHNKLRLEKGLPELLYDCEFEDAASKEDKSAGHLAEKNYGKLVFERPYERSVLSVVETAFNELKSDPEALRLMANPKATRFGCWGRLYRDGNTKQKKTRVTCVYDNKPE